MSSETRTKLRAEPIKEAMRYGLTQEEADVDLDDAEAIRDWLGCTAGWERPATRELKEKARNAWGNRLGEVIGSDHA